MISPKNLVIERYSGTNKLKWFDGNVLSGIQIKKFYIYRKITPMLGADLTKYRQDDLNEYVNIGYSFTPEYDDSDIYSNYKYTYKVKTHIVTKVTGLFNAIKSFPNFFNPNEIEHSLFMDYLIDQYLDSTYFKITTDNIYSKKKMEDIDKYSTSYMKLLAEVIKNVKAIYGIKGIKDSYLFFAKILLAKLNKKYNLIVGYENSDRYDIEEINKQIGYNYIRVNEDLRSVLHAGDKIKLYECYYTHNNEYRTVVNVNYTNDKTYIVVDEVFASESEHGHVRLLKESWFNPTYFNVVDFTDKFDISKNGRYEDEIKLIRNRFEYFLIFEQYIPNKEIFSLLKETSHPCGYNMNVLQIDRTKDEVFEIMTDTFVTEQNNMVNDVYNSLFLNFYIYGQDGLLYLPNDARYGISIEEVERKFELFNLTTYKLWTPAEYPTYVQNEIVYYSNSYYQCNQASCNGTTFTLGEWVSYTE